MSSAEERREALANVFLLPTPFDKQSALIELWLAEKDTQLVTRNIEIERLRNQVLRMTDAVADERRRTAEEIKRRAPLEAADGYGGLSISDVASICDEVGGSDE